MKLRLTLVLMSLCGTLAGQGIDLSVLSQVHTERWEALDGPMQTVTHSAYSVSAVIPFIYFVQGMQQKDSIRVRQSISMIGALGASSLITLTLKHAVGRERPYARFPLDFSNLSQSSTMNPMHSFPSGHTSLAFSTATSFTLVAPKWYVVVPMYTWASCVAYSRMHLGVHYPSDVIVGAVIGAGSAWLSHVVTQRIFRKR